MKNLKQKNEELLNKIEFLEEENQKHGKKHKEKLLVIET